MKIKLLKIFNKLLKNIKKEETNEDFFNLNVKKYEKPKVRAQQKNNGRIKQYTRK